MRAIGIILAGGSSDMRLKELTNSRATSAMPVGSCYRVIDFALSNMVRSNVNKVAVITQFNSRSLHDHLNSAKWWDFGRKQGGLFVLSPFLSQDNPFWFRGTADSIYQNMTFLRKSNEKYVVISSGDAVYKMDYRDIISKHKENGADITVVYKDLQGRDLTKLGILQMDESGKIIEFEEKPEFPKGSLASLGIYVIERELLMNILSDAVPNGGYDFVTEFIINRLNSLNIYGYKYDGYWSSIASGIQEYYATNMDFLKREIREIFTKDEPYIGTKPKDEPPVKYNFNADVKNVIVGSGSIINGSVKNSVLFRRVYVGDNSNINGSIILEGCHIGNDCIIENAILDKDVTVSNGKSIIGTIQDPIIIKKGSTV